MINKLNISLKSILLPLIILVVFFLLLSSQLIAAEKEYRSSLLFIASSTYGVIKEVSELWIENNYKHNFRISSSSSGILAKQIISGAPADLYLSASPLWMKELQKSNLVLNESVTEIFSNKLVLIAHKDSNYQDLGIIENNIKIKEIFKESLVGYRLSIADSSHVPAGMYSRQVLKNLKIWNELYPNKLAFGSDVRKALKFVALGASPLGIVYYSDTILEPNIKILGFFSEKLHDPIKYLIAINSKSKNPNTKKFLAFLLNEKAQEIFSKHGFTNIRR